MAEMSPQAVHKISEGTVVLSGERLRVQILNADGSEKTLIWDDAVPSDKNLELTVLYTGKLVTP